MIVVHLIHDVSSLLACSLTCYSWYIAVVPHIHDTLITPIHRLHLDTEFTWPKPLQHMQKLGLLPLVKKLQVRARFYDNTYGFSPQLFNCCILRRFAALSNVQELGIEYLNIPKFLPKIRRYFGHFLPTLRSLALRAPKGNHRQIIYFIGLFQHLEDLKLLYGPGGSQDEPAHEPMLAPPFAPPLRGRLTVTCLTRVGFLEDMIDLLGGIRFRHMDICNVDGMRLLLDTCAKTLETLRLHPTDPRGGGISLKGVRAPANAFVARSFLQDFDLSRNKSLRILEITASSIANRKPGFFTHVLSTITSPAFLEVVILYRDYDFRVVIPPQREDSRMCYKRFGSDVHEALWHYRLFEVFREMREIRKFRLVLCVDVWDRVGEYSVQALKQAVAAEKTQKGFDNTFPEPSVIYSPQRSCRYGFLESCSADTIYPWFPL